MTAGPEGIAPETVVTAETVNDNVLPTIVPRKPDHDERRDKSGSEATAERRRFEIELDEIEHPALPAVVLSSTARSSALSVNWSTWARTCTVWLPIAACSEAAVSAAWARSSAQCQSPHMR